MKLKHILIGLGVLVVLLVAANAMGLIGGKEIQQVTVDKATTRDIVETVTASGKIQPATEVKLSSEVSGEVVELLVREGDVVKKGQLLCRVRPDVLKSGYDRATASYSAQKAGVASAEQQLEQAKGNMANAEVTFKRNKELFNKKVISAAEFDAANIAYLTAKTSLETAKQSLIAAKFNLAQTGANVQEAGANLAKATIYAPVDGVVSKLSIELGDRILGTAQMAGTEIMRISNLTNMEVNVDVNENDINRVKIGDKATIEVDAFADEKFDGVVTEIASSSTAVGAATNSVDQVTNFTVKVRIIVSENNKYNFRPGLSATVDVQSSTEKGISIPIQAVFIDSKKVEDKDNKANAEQDAEKQKARLNDKKIKQFVYLFNKGTLKKVEVTTGIQDDQFIIVKSGIKEGEEIVTGPYSAFQNKLKDGLVVEKIAAKDNKKEEKN
ncbi:efflux RND transporter periplasmic adaptor subunit [Pedobacter flavus]|uniref:Efflux RND transporter periplasmic adaptor subunit n=1 Tax=Pedobacter flavus TaxID=3113906 RepID=A0ABU7H1P2_9SPHI|nr:efflux RND transporter periplasmic adaptor subunit [Pedobacter sp. VNH31]MEE1884933.1 efflux RND transporter periplasmic adaptor subunit [Pedobacter sp. VNH31]